MPRSLEFDPSDVAEKAMHVFWKKGVEHTSISDLVEATGVQRSGLYNVFGSKDGLFEKSFALYIKNVVQVNFAKHFDKPDVGLEDIIKYFEAFKIVYQTPMGMQGCLMCSTAISKAAERNVVDTAITNMFETIIGYFTTALSNSRKRNLITIDVPDRQIAESLMGSVLGLANMCRSPNARPLVPSYVAGILARLENL